MINSKHEDDHMDELADLKTNICTIKTIIAKMKKRDELKNIYKEYMSKSVWAQNRFKKKNANKIEENEEAVSISRRIVQNTHFRRLNSVIAGYGNAVKENERQA